MSRYAKSLSNKIIGMNCFECFVYFESEEPLVYGYALEKIRGEIRVCSFVFFIFDGFDSINLNFSNYYDYPKGYIDISEKTKELVISDLVDLVNGSIEELRSVSSIKSMIEYILSNQVILRNSWVLRSLINCLVYSGRYDEAMHYSNILLDRTLDKSQEIIKEDVKEMLELIQCGELLESKKRLLDRKNRNKWLAVKEQEK